MSDNLPQGRLAVITVSRNCFPVSLSRRRLAALGAALRSAAIEAICRIGDREERMWSALRELAVWEQRGVVYLGNFGRKAGALLCANLPSGDGGGAPRRAVMIAGRRGDAYCGLLNLSYNLALRRVSAYIPARPVGLPSELAAEIGPFRVLARILLGIPALKVIAFGPRPHDFFACHAPLQPLAELGVEVMENSELDLLQIFRTAQSHRDKRRIAAYMAAALRCGRTYPALLPLAQLEVVATMR